MKAELLKTSAFVTASALPVCDRRVRLVGHNLHRPFSVALLLVSTLTCFAQVDKAIETAQVPSSAPSSPAPATASGTPAPLPPPSASQTTVQPASVLAMPPAVPASNIDNANYVIGADDNLQITVWREPSLSGLLPVRPDGMISLVLIGDLKAAGKTPTQLSADIAQQLKKYIQDPSVTVAVTAVNSQRIFMVGEVGHVGPVAMSPGMTPLQAISSAGGPSPYANLKRIYILRGLGAKQQKIPFNYKQALKGDNRQDITLQPGDTIVVP